MIPFEEAGRILDEAAEALPREIFEGLNGGVSLLPDARTEDGGSVLGMYFVNSMGRYVEIYYGSFEALYSDADDETVRRQLIVTLKHELTHHIEHRAGDRTLEREDALRKAGLLPDDTLPPLEVQRVLFLCGDGAGLSPLAAALFREECRCRHLDGLSCAWGALDAPAARFDPGAEKAAASLGLAFDAAAPQAVTEQAVLRADAVLCMTLAQAETAAACWPEKDEACMTLAAQDLIAPRTGRWGRTIRRLRDEVGSLLDELCEEAGHA